VHEPIADRHFAGGDEGGDPREQPDGDERTGDEFDRARDMMIGTAFGGMACAIAADIGGKCRIFCMPCSKNRSPATMRRILSNCGWYFDSQAM
jgi:hypothetical protein